MKPIITVTGAIIIAFASSAMAADADKGQEVFNANCTGCHSGGNNALVPEKTLKKDALKKNDRYSDKAIIELVTNGSSTGMPGFGKLGTISAPDIENVAAFVLKKAEAGW